MTISEKLERAKTDIDDVFNAGKQAEYDAFWDILQDKGNRKNYQFAFGGHGWTDETFKPKYDIVLDKSYNAGLFRTCTKITDLYALTIGRGLAFDTSKATSLNEAFASCLAMNHIPALDISSTTSAYGLCLSCKKLITIDKLVSGENVKWYSNSFQDCESLENLIVEGTIGQDGFDVHWSVNLSKASIESIMSAITTTKAITVTFSKTAVDKAFETTEGANDGSTSIEWETLVDTRPLSTIALA